MHGTNKPPLMAVPIGADALDVLAERYRAWADIQAAMGISVIRPAEQK